jgi:hypothetical protein
MQKKDFLQHVRGLTGSGDNEEDIGSVAVRNGRIFGLISLSSGGP